MPRHIKRMMTALKGRALAYRAALAEPGSPEKLAEALLRNLYGTLAAPPPETKLAAMADYVREFESRLEAQTDEEFSAGRAVFPQLSDSKDHTHGEENQQAA